MEEKLLDWEDNTENLPFYKHMLAGSFAGLTEHSIAFPFDTLRTYAQAETTKLVSITDTISFMKRVGFFSMWKGVTSVLYGCIPAHAVYFSVYELSKKSFKIESNNNLYFFSTSLTGIIATACHDCIMTPMDVVKQRIQLTRKLSPLRMMAYINHTEGVIGLYRSLPITLVMNVPQAALFMTFYENFKSYLFKDGNVTMLGYFGCAGLAGAISSGLTTPMDVIKTRLQTQTEQSSVLYNDSLQKYSRCVKPECDENGCRKPRYCTIRGTIELIIKQDGYSAFFRGIIPRMMFVLPGAAVSWSTYEYIKGIIT